VYKRQVIGKPPMAPLAKAVSANGIPHRLKLMGYPMQQLNIT